jgi:PAS domain S-box-containing protein
VVVGVTCATFALSAAFELREWLTEVTHPLERYQIDELPLTFAALALALAWFAWRRWRQSEEELGLRMQAQQALAERESQYRLLFMENLAGNALTAADGTIRVCNPAMARILGLADPDRAIGRALREFYASREQWAHHQDALCSGRQLELPLLELVAADGAAVKVIARMLPRIPQAASIEFQVYLADISELQLMQKELSETLAQNRLLSQKYVLVQEEERRNLARELHDEMGQFLNAIKLDAVSIRDVARSAQPEIEARAESIVELSSHVFEAVRGIMQRLRPAALDALGLRDAVNQLVVQWQRRNPAVECTFEVSGSLSGFGELVNITVYRLVQECLTNVAKHARAKHVAVRLQRASEDELQLSVRDDGRGMELDAKRSGLGLIGLRERVEALNGRLLLASAPGGGLEVFASLPVARAPHPTGTLDTEPAPAAESAAESPVGIQPEGTRPSPRAKEHP